MRLKVFFACVFLFCSVTFLYGCGGGKAEEQSLKSVEENKKTTNSLVTSGVLKDQLAMPNKGDEIAILSVKDYGDIWCRLFPEVAPKAVENFKELAGAGKYKDVLFHRVIEDFMIQTGGESESIYKKQKESFPVELNQTARHLNGALCMARTNSLKDGQSSQFYIVCSKAGKTANLDQIKNQTKLVNFNMGYNIYPKYSENDIKNYKDLGGSPALDMQYTCFGHVIKGMDIVQKISECKKSDVAGPTGEKSLPDPEIRLSDVRIEVFNGSLD